MKGYENIGQFLLTGIAIVISLTIHEYSHGLISTSFGDDTPKKYGRLTLNPLAHIDIVGLVCLFLFRFGWAKPVPINPDNYKNRKLGIIVTSLAGPISNIILAFLSIIIYFSTEKYTAEGVKFFLTELAWINTGLAVFNLIPLPPLDGSKVVAELFGGAVARFIYKMSSYGTFIIFGLLLFAPIENVIVTAISATFKFLCTVAALMIWW